MAGCQVTSTPVSYTHLALTAVSVAGMESELSDIYWVKTPAPFITWFRILMVAAFLALVGLLIFFRKAAGKRLSVISERLTLLARNAANRVKQARLDEAERQEAQKKREETRRIKQSKTAARTAAEKNRQELAAEGQKKADEAARTQREKAVQDTIAREAQEITQLRAAQDGARAQENREMHTATSLRTCLLYTSRCV